MPLQVPQFTKTALGGKHQIIMSTSKRNIPSQHFLCSEESQKSSYRPLLPGNDSQEDLVSNSTGNFDEIVNHEPCKHNRFLHESIKSSRMLVLVAVMLLVIVTETIALAMIAHKSMSSGRPLVEILAPWSPWTSEYFDRPHQTVEWKANVRYMTLDHRFDHYWNETATSSIINTPYPNGTEHLAVVTMVHQIHCLVALREALQVASEGGPVAHDFRQNSHWPHCLDYLYQGILCYADGTIERPDLVNGTEGDSISGYRAKRTCGSSANVFRLRDEHRWEEA